MATSGSVTVRVTNYDNLVFNWWRNSYDSAGNYSDIGWELLLVASNYGYIYSSASKSCSVNIDGNNYSGTNSVAINNNSTKTLASGTTRIYHNNDGTKSFSFSFSQYFGITFSGSSIGTITGSGESTLDTIPRYANFTEHYVQSTGLNSITVHWNADANCDWCQYSLNGGNWADCAGLTYTINGLGPNTQYNIRTRIRRTDSQLWTESGYIYGTTKEVAKITSAVDFNLGDSTTIGISNPSGNNILLRAETLNKTVSFLSRNVAVGNNTINFTDTELDTIYKKMGISNSTPIRFVIDTYGDTTYCHWQDRTCVLTGNQKSIKNNISGTWKRGKIWINVDNTNRRGVVWRNNSGTWKRGI